MCDASRARQPGRFLAAVALAGLLAGAAFSPARAAELDKLDSSLKFIPADAAFYSSSLRTREQIEIVAKSKAWAQLKAIPAVKDLWQKAEDQLAGPLQQLEQFTKVPENKQLLDLLGDMVSHEIFVYGGENSAAFAQLLLEVNQGVSFAPLMLLLSDKGGQLNEQEVQMLAVLRTLAANLDLLKAPDVIIGFKVSDTKRAKAQLKRLQDILQGLAALLPQAQGRVNTQKVGDTEYLTVMLDGKLVPWENVPFQKLEKKKGEFDKLAKRLAEMKLTVSLGVRDNYLLLSFDETTAALARLGKGPLLAQRPELQPLAKFADRRVTSVGYVSKSAMARLTADQRSIDQLVKVANEFLDQSKLSSAERDQIRKDLAELAKDVKGYITEPGALMSFAFLTPRGIESYSHDWGQHSGLDGSKPLTILSHLGGSPLLAAVGRTKYDPQQYQLLVKWIKVGNGYFEQFAVPQMQPEQKEKYQEFTKTFHPLFRQLDTITGKMLLPALADGQKALVFDAKMTSKQWFKAMPPSDQPLPMLEVGILLGVSDPALLQKAGSAYRKLGNAMWAAMRKLAPEAPEFEIPEPKTRQMKSGTLYYYPLPENLGLDRRLVPNVALAENLAVLSLSPEHSERLLTRTPLRLSSGPLADVKRNLVGAIYFDWAGLIDAATPWVDYGVGTYLAQNGADEKTVAGILKQVHSGAEVLKALRTITSATYFEGKVLVTHSETVFRDL